MICPNCKQETAAGAFCAVCGAPLSVDNNTTNNSTVVAADPSVVSAAVPTEPATLPPAASAVPATPTTPTNPVTPAVSAPTPAAPVDPTTATPQVAAPTSTDGATKKKMDPKKKHLILWCAIGGGIVVLLAILGVVLWMLLSAKTISCNNAAEASEYIPTLSIDATYRNHKITSATLSVVYNADEELIEYYGMDALLEEYRSAIDDEDYPGAEITVEQTGERQITTTIAVSEGSEYVNQESNNYESVEAAVASIEDTYSGMTCEVK